MGNGAGVRRPQARVARTAPAPLVPVGKPGPQGAQRRSRLRQLQPQARRARFRGDERGRLDSGVLGEVLEHVPDDRAGLAEVARVLEPAGLLALSVPANPARYGPSDEWGGHVRRDSREAVVEAGEAGGFRVLRCKAWGFPVSGLYHRHLYERRLNRHGPASPRRWERPALAVLSALLQVDRLFVGVERGA